MDQPVMPLIQTQLGQEFNEPVHFSEDGVILADSVIGPPTLLAIAANGTSGFSVRLGSFMLLRSWILQYFSLLSHDAQSGLISALFSLICDNSSLASPTCSLLRRLSFLLNEFLFSTIHQKLLESNSIISQSSIAFLLSFCARTYDSFPYSLDLLMPFFSFLELPFLASEHGCELVRSSLHLLLEHTFHLSVPIILLHRAVEFALSVIALHVQHPRLVSFCIRFVKSLVIRNQADPNHFLSLLTSEIGNYLDSDYVLSEILAAFIVSVYIDRTCRF
jgi:hypothetical protein